MGLTFGLSAQDFPSFSKSADVCWVFWHKMAAVYWPHGGSTLMVVKVSSHSPFSDKAL